MADTYSIKAILSAKDAGFTTRMNNARSTLANLKSTVTSGIGFGVMMGAGQKAFDVISSGVSGIISDLGEASSTWKTFQGNMEMTGKSADEIKNVKKELQDFATATIYSASDMASTYAQLEAVGTKNTTKLVKGFGGLASAAENPKQAMRTLSQQATQMAAKPKVAWEDFKLMLEQAPAGIAAIAKQMGMTTSELIKNVQDGTVATEDFFDAISAVGTNDAFTKLATEYKTVGQAMDGLTETATTKLQPSFDKLSGYGIRAVEKITSAFDKIDGDALAAKIGTGVEIAGRYWNELTTNMQGVGTAFRDAFSAIGDSFSEVSGEIGSDTSIQSFGDGVKVAAGYLKTFAGFLENNADKIALVMQHLPQLLVAYQGFKILKTAAPLLNFFAGGLTTVATVVGKGLAGKLFGVSKGQEQVGKSSSKSSTKILTSAKAFMMMGAGVLAVAAGFGIIAYSAVQLANSGGLAIGVMAGMVGAVAALGAGMTVMINSISPGPAKLKAIAVTMLAFGAAVLMVSAGFAIMAQSSIALANAGAPAIATMFGMVGAMAGLMVVAGLVGQQLTAGAVGLVAFGAAVLIAGAGMYLMASAAIALSEAGTPAIACMFGMVGVMAGLMVLAAALGPALTAGAVGMIAFVGALVLVATSALIGAAALAVVAAVLPTITSCGTSGAVAIAQLGASMVAFGAGTAVAGAGCIVLAAGLITVGAGAVVAGAGFVVLTAGLIACSAGVVVLAASLKLVNSSMKSIASNAKSAQKSLTSMVGSVNIVNAGLDALGNKAKSAISKLISHFSKAESKAQSSGQAVGNNFNSGVQSGMSRAVSTANTMSISVTSAMRSASSGAYSSGVYIGAGLANGMASQIGYVRSVAAQLASAAEAAIRAKARIHSPSKVTDKLGGYYGIGWVNGILDKVRMAKQAAEKLVNIPKLVPAVDMGLSGYSFNDQLNDEYCYGSGGAVYTIYVPVELDGREMAKATATYTQEELEKIDTRNRRKKGNR